MRLIENVLDKSFKVRIKHIYRQKVYENNLHLLLAADSTLVPVDIDRNLFGDPEILYLTKI